MIENDDMFYIMLKKTMCSLEDGFLLYNKNEDDGKYLNKKILFLFILEAK